MRNVEPDKDPMDKDKAFIKISLDGSVFRYVNLSRILKPRFRLARSGIVS